MTRYDNQATIKWKIMENNEQHFQMMETTPPMQEPLVTELGYLGNTEAARQILDGTYVYPNGINLPTQQFLSSLQVTAPITASNHIVPSVSREDFQHYWKASHEQTSSTYSQIHFGHWKANADCNFLSEIHALFTDIVISTGHSPSRWQNGLSVMLEKKPGLHCPDKLWAIALLEGDFNWANKLFIGKHMMDWAETNEPNLPSETYGGQKHFQAIDMSISHCVTLNLFCQKCLTGAIASIDASNCFNRLAHNVTSIACQCLGIQIETLTCLLVTIQLMNFFLCTAFGDSTGCYGTHNSVLPNPSSTPLQGSCQGNGGTLAYFLLYVLYWSTLCTLMAMSQSWSEPFQGAKCDSLGSFSLMTLI